MKRLSRSLALSVVAFTLACGPATAPVAPAPPPAAPPSQPPAVPPAPADPAPVTEGDVTLGFVNGVKVIVKRIPGAELAAAELYVEGGVRNVTRDNAGVEELAFATAASGGTETLSKDAFARKLAELGSQIDGDASYDYALFSAKSLIARYDETFALLVDAFLHPALPPTEIELERQRQLADLRHEVETPDGRLALALHRALFAGHPYENRPVGTIESVSRLDRNAIAAHLSKLRETSRLLFVAAGDLDATRVLGQIRAAFGALPRGTYTAAPPPSLRFSKPSIEVEDKQLPTNYVSGAFPAPSWHDADFPAALVASRLLDYRIFEEVRTKRNLSYAPHARLDPGRAVGTGALYVTAVDPNAALKVMLDEVRKLKTAPVPTSELAGTKATYLTGYLMSNESTDGQAHLLAVAELLGGDWHLGRTLPDRIAKVTAADVQSFAQKYLANLQTRVVGDPKKIDKALFSSL